MYINLCTENRHFHLVCLKFLNKTQRISLKETRIDEELVWRVFKMNCDFLRWHFDRFERKTTLGKIWWYFLVKEAMNIGCVNKEKSNWVHRNGKKSRNSNRFSKDFCFSILHDALTLELYTKVLKQTTPLSSILKALQNISAFGRYGTLYRIQLNKQNKIVFQNRVSDTKNLNSW